MKLPISFSRSSKLLVPASVVVVAGLCVPATAFATPEGVGALAAGSKPHPRQPNKADSKGDGNGDKDCTTITISEVELEKELPEFDLGKVLSKFAPQHGVKQDKDGSRPKKELKIKIGTISAKTGTWKLKTCPCPGGSNNKRYVVIVSGAEVSLERSIPGPYSYSCEFKSESTPLHITVEAGAGLTIKVKGGIEEIEGELRDSCASPGHPQSGSLGGKVSLTLDAELGVHGDLSAKVVYAEVEVPVLSVTFTGDLAKATAGASGSFKFQYKNGKPTFQGSGVDFAPITITFVKLNAAIDIPDAYHKEFKLDIVTKDFRNEPFNIYDGGHWNPPF